MTASSPFHEFNGTRHIYHPGFKFLSEEYAAKLWCEGSVRIPQLAEFRKHILEHADGFEGLIFDRREGQATLVRDGNLREVDMGHLHAYCFTQHFLSQSLNWALQDNKEVAVLIINVESFLNEIASVAGSSGFKLVQWGECLYLGGDDKFIDSDPLLAELETSPTKVSLLKPERYAAQLEVRAVWEADDRKCSDIILAPNAALLCIPVVFPTIREHANAYLANANTPVGCRFYVRGKAISECPTFIAHSGTVLTPIVHHKEDDEPQMGLWLPQRSLSNVSMSNGKVGMKFMEGGLISLCDVPLRDVMQIEYFAP